jgi:signal transduction histidine kinase
MGLRDAAARPSRAGLWVATWGSGLRRVRLFETMVVLPTAILVSWRFTAADYQYLSDESLLAGAIFWTVVIGVVEFLPIPIWRSLQVGPGFPLFTAVAFIYPASVAAFIAFLGASDPREIKGQVRPLRALFNRSQLGLAVFCSSSAFHALGGRTNDWVPELVLAAPAAVLAFHIVNIVLVGIALGLTYERPFQEVLRHLKIGNAFEYFVSYLGLGLLGVLLARLYVDVGSWAVAAFVMPLLLARQMFFRTRALEEATRELQDREAILRSLSTRMAEERQDERKAIAGYLHDDLAQVLYRMSLHLDISEKQLDMGDPDKVRDEIVGLRNSRDRAMELVRGLIKDLHRSPLGREGLNEALRSYATDVQKQTGLTIETQTEEAPMAPPVQLLCYHVAREAVMNAVKHAEASTITITLEKTEEGARLKVHDNGKGFDVDEGEPEGHYGLTMMKERAQVSGGSFRIDSGAGKGTTVTADFPTSWMIEPTPGDQNGDPAPAEGLPASQR